jgi:hypothetical protein
MQTRMLSVQQHQQVGDHVVCAIPIKMMNHFVVT